MADLSAVLDNYFTVASETFADNLSASIAAGAATVPVNNNSEYTNGDCVVLTVDPGTVNEATFIGKKSGLNFIECIWTEGNTAVGHSNGATIIDYDSATHHNAQTKGIQQFANDDGTLKTEPVRTALGLGATSVNGWEVLPYTLSVTSGYNKGNKEYDITVANQDLRTTLSAGMKLRLERGTTAPTQCADLESSSSQFASRASGSVTGTISTVTDDITCEAWIKPESMTSKGWIVSKLNASAVNGFGFNMEAGGTIRIIGGNAAAYDYGQSYVGVEIGRWSHVAGTLDMSGASSTLYINGISVPVQYTNGAASAWVNAGNLQIGAYNSIEYFDGKIADVRVWNVIRTATQIRDNMNQQLVGTETNLIGYWKLNGDFNDSTSAANHLTGSGGAVATDLDNPMKTTEYAIITKVAYSAPNTTLTVYTGTDHNIPNLTLSAPYYSTQRTPYGFPASSTRWTLTIWANRSADYPQATPTINQWYNVGFFGIDLPTGMWDMTLGGTIGATGNAAPAAPYYTLSEANNTEGTMEEFNGGGYNSTSGGTHLNPVFGAGSVEVSAQTRFYANMKIDAASTDVRWYSGRGAPVIRAKCAYL